MATENLLILAPTNNSEWPIQLFTQIDRVTVVNIPICICDIVSIEMAKKTKN